MSFFDDQSKRIAARRTAERAGAHPPTDVAQNFVKIQEPRVESPGATPPPADRPFEYAAALLALNLAGWTVGDWLRRRRRLVRWTLGPAYGVASSYVLESVQARYRRAGG